MPSILNVDTWEALAAQIKGAVEANQKIYRGVTDFDGHKLIPKIGRPGARKDPANGSGRPYSEEDEKRLLEVFRRTARPFLSYEPKSDFEWLAVAQHHGSPTRLLDWTESPLVAAYFAMEKAGTSGKPAVYVLDPPPKTSDSDDPFSIPTVRSYHPPHISPRIQAQSSVFTIHPRPELEYDPPGLIVWLFPGGQPCWEIKRVIDRCGFNRASLFPGLDGLAEHVGWCYKWGGSEGRVKLRQY
mgnify:CR=1 FL=1